MEYPTHIADVLESFLEVACTCLEGTSTGRPTDCFVSWGQPAWDCCDMLAIYMNRLRPSRGFQDAQYVTGGALWDKCCDQGKVMDIGIELVRPCYPALSDDPINPFPTAEEQHAAAVALLEDAWVLQCCLNQAACDGLLFPDYTNCLEIGWGDLVPKGPEGGCAGFVWYLTVELEPCC